MLSRPSGLAGGRHRAFRQPLIDRLCGFRFTGNVDSIPVGTVFFADQPIPRGTAPLARHVGTQQVNLPHFQTVIASRAARMVLAAGRRDAGAKAAPRRSSIGAVRLDTGGPGAPARSVRAIRDAGGVPDVTIFASGGLDKTAIARPGADAAA